jgi:Caspase domain
MTRECFQMMRFLRRFGLVATLVFLGGHAHAQTPPPGKRHALLIGVNAYQAITPLQKAVGDAEALSQALTVLNYEVMLVRDPTRRQMNEAVAAFTAKLKPEDTAIVHFSGHGIEIAQQNFLLPIDVPLPAMGTSGAGADLIKSEAIALSDLMARVDASGVGTKIFIIDACRDNPFAARGVRSVGATRGLNVNEPSPGGTFLLYSAGIGEQALDRLSATDPEPTSVYTRALLRKFSGERPILYVAKDLQRDVRLLARQIGHAQQPGFYDQFLTSDSFYIDPAKDPLKGWTTMCAASPPAPSDNAWLHNGSAMFMVADGNKRRLHYVAPRKSIKDQGVTPNCMLVDGEVRDGRFVGKAHIYRERCGQYAYDVVGDYNETLERFELKGPSPIVLENCRVARFEAASANATLVFQRPAPPAPVVLPVAAPVVVPLVVAPAVVAPIAPAVVPAVPPASPAVVPPVAPVPPKQ